MPDAGNVTLYVRQGGGGDNKDNGRGGGESPSPLPPERWPYLTSQVVLLEVEDDSRRTHLVPSAAILSVLPSLVPSAAILSVLPSLLPSVVVHPATTGAPT